MFKCYRVNAKPTLLLHSQSRMNRLNPAKTIASFQGISTFDLQQISSNIPLQDLSAYCYPQSASEWFTREEGSIPECIQWWFRWTGLAGRFQKLEISELAVFFYIIFLPCFFSDISKAAGLCFSNGLSVEALAERHSVWAPEKQRGAECAQTTMELKKHQHGEICQSIRTALVNLSTISIFLCWATNKKSGSQSHESAVRVFQAVVSLNPVRLISFQTDMYTQESNNVFVLAESLQGWMHARWVIDVFRTEACMIKTWWKQ